MLSSTQSQLPGLEITLELGQTLAKDFEIVGGRTYLYQLFLMPLKQSSESVASV